MTSRVATTTFNCLDAHALSQWWKPVLGYVDLPDDPNEPGDDECVIHDPATGHQLLFGIVEELQDPEGRMHLDLAPVDRTRDEEVERVLGLGASQVADRRNPDGTGWVVLADPDGNLFCIVRSDAERVAPDAPKPSDERATWPAGPEPAVAGTEAATMLGSLERQRATFAWKCSGLDADGMRAKVGASSMTLGGLLLHLGLVEDIYFSGRLGGTDPGTLWPDADFEDWDWAWTAAASRSPEELLTSWQAAVRRSRAVTTTLLAGGGLGQLAQHGDWTTPPSLRRILADLIEEYARHVGHADLLRESVDGVTGEDAPPDFPGWPPLQ